MRISDWSSDVCSSDLDLLPVGDGGRDRRNPLDIIALVDRPASAGIGDATCVIVERRRRLPAQFLDVAPQVFAPKMLPCRDAAAHRSEEHTSELQSLMRISYAVFCLKKKNINQHRNTHTSDLMPHRHSKPRKTHASTR